MSRILHIPDLHLPFVHKNALKFVCRLRDAYKCDTIIQGGDFFDNYSWSKYMKDPDSFSPSIEFKIASKQVKEWVKEFPKMIITTGNHCIRIFKKLKEAGIPSNMLHTTLNDIWGLPKTWQWVSKYEHDGILFFHGSKCGEYSHVNNAKDMRQSTVTVHTHSSGGVHFMSNFKNNMFAMNTGCLIDDKTYAFNYSHEMTRRPVLGAGIIIEGHPQFIPME